MKSDLDALMQEREIDALLITGPGQHNPAMYYMTGGAHLTNALLLRRRGGEPVLFNHSMERDEAARTGLPTREFNEFGLQELRKQYKDDQLTIMVKLYQRILEENGISSGRMAVYGQEDAGTSYALYSSLGEEMPGLNIVGEMNNSLIMAARATKDAVEIEHIRKMGRITTTVVGRTAEFLSSHQAKEEVLVNSDGSPLTIGEVKGRINLWLAELGAENPEGTIFAIGRDAGVPHSTGGAGDYLRLGQTIVFDIYPCEAGGGYFYDFTRTWSLGYAPEEVQALYDDVRSVFDRVMSELRPGEPCKQYQDLTCDLFEAQGHPTVKSNPTTQEGYVHSLGHGLGLDVHERPIFGVSATENDRLDPGVVVTIEPGLYYPERGMGVRLEDTVWVDPQGKIEVLAEYPYDLVLPVKN